MKTCCICGKQFEGYGNNPIPIKLDGVCCDNCNMTKVLSARLSGVTHDDIEKSEKRIMYHKCMTTAREIKRLLEENYEVCEKCDEIIQLCESYIKQTKQSEG